MEEQRHVLAGMSCSPVVRFTEKYVENRHNTISDGRTLDFIPPLEQVNRMISRLEQFKNVRGREFIVEINGSYLDVVELRKLRLLHEKKDIKYEVTQEIEWFRKISDGLNQPTGSPVVDSTLAATFCSMLQDTSEGHFWPNMQLKTCEIKRLAVNHWLSDLVVYRIGELLSDSDPDVFVFYYTFVTDISSIGERIRAKHPNAKPNKIIFAINLGKLNGKTYLGNTMIGNKLVSGCHFAMGVYYAEQNEWFYGDSQGWLLPENVVGDLQQLISVVYGSETSHNTVFSMCHTPQKNEIFHSCSKECWKHYPLQTCSHICGISVIISMCLAACPDDSFLSLKGGPEQATEGFAYIRRISDYNEFLCLVVMQWLLTGKVDISLVRCAHTFNGSTSLHLGEEETAAPVTSEAQKQDSSCNATLFEGKQMSAEDSLEKCTPCSSVPHVCNIPLSSRNNTICSLVDECSTADGRKCKYIYKHHHCTLCPPWKHFQSLYHITRHIQQARVNPSRTFDFNGYRIVPCKQEHPDCKYSESRYHYHCPLCNKTVLHKSLFEQHLQGHSCDVNASKSFQNTATKTKSITITEVPNQQPGSKIISTEDDKEAQLATATTEKQDEFTYVSHVADNISMPYAS